MATRSIPSIPGKEKPYIMAHRGSKALMPENTLAAFRRALQDGADLLETDLHQTADGIFVCIHDSTVDRTTDGTGKVSEMSLAELKKLSASCGMPEYRSEKIPTLAEFMAILPEDRATMLELKSDCFTDRDVCRQLIDELTSGGIAERCVLGSFSMARLQHFRDLAPDIPLAWLTLTQIRPERESNLLGPFWPILFINPFYTWLAHRRGQGVCPLDPTPERRLWYYRLIGCDAILTDNPGLTCKKMNKCPQKNPVSDTSIPEAT